jgi:hypothetical protein
MFFNTQRIVQSSSQNIWELSTPPKTSLCTLAFNLQLTKNPILDNHYHTYDLYRPTIGEISCNRNDALCGPSCLLLSLSTVFASFVPINSLPWRSMTVSHFVYPCSNSQKWKSSNLLPSFQESLTIWGLMSFHTKYSINFFPFLK